jgi:predicted aminopeptidase
VDVLKRFRGLRVVARVAVALVLFGVALLALTPTGRYLARGAWEEAKILWKRRPISEIIADPATSPELRDKLTLVLAARAFAADSLGLRAKQSFTTFSQTGHDTLTLVVSAAYRDKLKSYTWWFPVVGRVPYKGYFDFGEARRQERLLYDRGFDTRLGAVSAFSTLGWFNDPLLPSTLRADSLTLANTVIHELTHNTYYAPGGAVFNESFANFVGARGAQRFFTSRGEPAAAAEVEARWEDEKVLGRFWASLYAEIDSVFKAHPGDEPAHVAERLALRDSVFGVARERFIEELGPRLKTMSIRAVQRIRLDNAILMSRRVYLTDLDAFDAVLAKNGGKLRVTIQQVIEAAKGDRKAPFEAVKRLTGLPSPASTSASAPTQAILRDSVLLNEELDGLPGRDRLVAEFRRADWQPEGAGADSVPLRVEQRVALYLGKRRDAAWDSGWDDMSVPRPRRAIALSAGGSLIGIDVESGDGGEALVVFVRHDSARVVLRQGGDYDGWLLRLREADRRVLADVAGFMVRNDSSTSSGITCAQPRLAGWTFVFDENAGEFVEQREACVDPAGRQPG